LSKSVTFLLLAQNKKVSVSEELKSSWLLKEKSKMKVREILLNIYGTKLIEKPEH
jgi:hypothetical protein